MRIERKRVGALAHRAAHDTAEVVWHDVKFAIAIVVVGSLVAWSLFDLPLDRVVLANIIAVAVIPLALFLISFIRVFRRPDEHRAWRRGRVSVIPVATGDQAPGLLEVAIEPRKPLYIGRNRCEITDPDGHVWLEPVDDGVERFVRGLSCTYPTSFPDAPPLNSGRYEVRWLIGVGRKLWREILRHVETVDLPEDTDPPTESA